MKKAARFYLLASLGFSLYLFSSCGIVRSIVFLAPNADDYRHDPQVRIEPGLTPFLFKDATASNDLGSNIWVSGAEEGVKLALDDFVKGYGTDAFVIIRNDTILYEAYATDRAKIDPVSSFSISKAIVTTLVGIAIKEGFINSIDQPICELLPEWRDKGFDNVRIINLMQHTSGMSFSTSIRNPMSDQVQFYYGRNLRKRMKRRKPDLPPGHDYEYQSANTILLTMVLEKATGIPIADYLESRIWQPLNMEAPASWSLDRQGRKSMIRSFCCLQAQALDFAKLGRLWLNNGIWFDEQILPKEWMHEILNKRSELTGRYRSGFRLFYGDPKIFYTSGLLGQYIYMVPDKNLLILRFGEHRERRVGRFWHKVFGEIIDQI
jgi:CubicO group peptidase (beta-lactamase class C family)